MRYSLKLFAFTLTLLLTSSVYAQNSIECTVKDKATGEPVPYAHISILGINRGTVANASGSFRIVTDQLPVTIKASCIGYTMQN